MPPPPEFFRRLPETSDEDLFEMLTLPEQYQPEALQAAREELRKRNVPPERIAELDAQGEKHRVEVERNTREIEERAAKERAKVPFSRGQAAVAVVILGLIEYYLVTGPMGGALVHGAIAAIAVPLIYAVVILLQL